MIGEDVYILIVDDERVVLQSFADMFSKEGYNVIKARSWFEAAQHLKLQNFNVVITDINLPDISYLEMIEKIKSSSKNTFIITTANYAEIETAIESLRHGANDYISKPFNPTDVIVGIRKLLEKQKLYSDNLKLYETIKSLALALEARDQYTSGHSQAVTDIAVTIAEEMKLQQEEIEKIREAGILHDIGKIGISDAILLKPGRLSIAEYNQIKKHPVIAKKILEPVSSLADKIPLIYHHHERFDGEGYPEGIKSDLIPLGARILAVADAYQAMTSERPYRNAMSKSKAIDELIRNKSKQFDPQVVDAFLRVVDKF